MKPISPFGLPIGIASSFWMLSGFLRLVQEAVVERFIVKKKKRRNPYKISEVCVLLPAHNEEVVIRDSIKALKANLKASQIYVVSDGSVDNTAREARKERVKVVELNPGRGKASALVYLMKHFDLYSKFKLILTMDADTRLDKTFFERALPNFADREVAVVFGGPRIHWQEHFLPRLRYYFQAYRERLDRVLQYFMLYGQTWKYTNVTYVIPGFCALFRSDILRKLPLDTPGILIEDFNSAFQVQKNKYGTVVHHPSLIAWDQHPDNLRDYWNQVRRWNIGLFQTMKVNGMWMSFFWLSLIIFMFESFVYSFLILLLPFLLLVTLVPGLSFLPFTASDFGNVLEGVPILESLGIWEVFFIIFAFDYSVTLLVGWITRKPQFAFYGLFFFFMHMVTALILLSAIVPGFFSTSDGRWRSPTRRKE